MAAASEEEEEEEALDKALFFWLTSPPFIAISQSRLLYCSLGFLMNQQNLDIILLNI